MRKIYVILFTVFLNVIAVSCTPTALQEDVTAQGDDCCGGGGEITPPPPPPPNGGG